MNKRVLFVDDEPNVLEGLQRTLRQMRSEWDMVFAASGEAALALMAEQPADVLITDMSMPGMNGAELLKQVMARYPTTVRLVLSGHADRELVAQCVGVANQYISKPCESEMLKSIIRNACLLSGGLVSDAVKRIIGSTDTLPSMPALYQRLKQALEDENVSSQILGDIIQQDMAMTAKILKLVNSAFFGLRRTIERPHEAVSYLGSETIKTLVLANGIFEQAAQFKTNALSLDDLWHHSQNVACGAKAIAKAECADRSVQEDSFVGGMLHDVGILVLASNFPDAYDRMARTILREQVSIPAAEMSEFGTTHAEVGAYLLGLWGLPAPILKNVGLHHQPQFAAVSGFNALLAVHIADVLSGRHDHHSLFKTATLDEPLLLQLGLHARLDVWRQLITSPSES